MRVFLKQILWGFKLGQRTKDELLEMLKKPDPEIEYLIWKFYLQKVERIEDLMRVVYDTEVFPKRSRLVAGNLCCMALSKLSENRISHLIGIYLYLPQMTEEVERVVDHHCNPHEQKIFANE